MMSRFLCSLVVISSALSLMNSYSTMYPAEMGHSAAYKDLKEPPEDAQYLFTINTEDGKAVSVSRRQGLKSKANFLVEVSTKTTKVVAFTDSPDRYSAKLKGGLKEFIVIANEVDGTQPSVNTNPNCALSFTTFNDHKGIGHFSTIATMISIRVDPHNPHITQILFKVLKGNEVPNKTHYEHVSITVDPLTPVIESLQSNIDSSRADLEASVSQLDTSDQQSILELQQQMNQYNLLMETSSSVLKTISDANRAIVQNIS